MIVLQAQHIQKSFAGDPILTDANLTIQEKDRIALIGINGAGKSTLLKILAGLLQPDHGSVYVGKQTRIGYLAQTGSLDTDQTIFSAMKEVFQHITEWEAELKRLEQAMGDETVLANPDLYEKILNQYTTLTETFEQAQGYAVDSKIRNVLHGLGFPEPTHQTKIHTLSGGQKTRLALCKLLLQEPEILMLDEPTNYLDMETVQWLEQYLRSYNGAVLVVSHDRYFLDRFADQIVELENGKTRTYKGNYTAFLNQKSEELEQRIKQYEQQQEEIERLEEFVRRNIARASTARRAQSKRKLLEKMDVMEKPLTYQPQAFFSFETAKRSGNDVLQATQLGVQFEGRWIFRDLNLSVRRGDRIALLGPNGIGKSTLIKTLIGELAPTEGTVRLGANVELGYYDQEQTSLHSDHTVLQEVWDAHPTLDRTTVRSVLGQFLFSGDDVEKTIGSLSGGEKARVSLAKLMLKQANFLVLDEPTNHLDLLSKEVLEEALMSYEGTLLFISHDRYFVNKLANRVLELTPEGLNQYLGNYDAYLEKKAERMATTTDTTKPVENQKSMISASQEKRLEEKQRQREERRRQQQLDQVEAEISRLEQELKEIEERLCDPSVYSDPEQSIATSARHQEVKDRLEELFLEWEALHE
jgi:ATP-binding cassette, subfamily F, member 3